MIRLVAAVLLAACSLPGYTRTVNGLGVPLRRVDSDNIRFLVNGASPAATAAIEAAMRSWSSVPASQVRFAPLETTAALNNPADGQNVFVFADTPEIRSLAGSALVVSVTIYYDDGRIADTDIIFNPQTLFSTDLTAGTYDLQSAATHELGHALGAGHSGLLAAAMYQTMTRESTLEARITSDDAAFLAEVYPSAIAAETYGVLRGTVSLPTGAPVRGALVAAIDPDSGIAVGGVTDVVTGGYSIRLPRGSYIVYAEPADGPVRPRNVQLDDSQVTPPFQTTFSQRVTVGGDPVTVDLAVAPDAPAFQVQFLGLDGVFNSGARAVSGGQTVELLLSGAGLDARHTVSILGPGVTVQPGSVKLDPDLTVSGLPVLRMKVDIAARALPAIVTIVVSKDSVAVVHSGGLLILPSAGCRRG